MAVLRVSCSFDKSRNSQHLTTHACRAAAPTKSNPGGKVLTRLRSTAATALVTESSLARASSLSSEVQFARSSSIALGTVGPSSTAAGPPQQNRLAKGLNMVSISAELPVQQLQGSQISGEAVSLLHLQSGHGGRKQALAAADECVVICNYQFSAQLCILSVFEPCCVINAEIEVQIAGPQQFNASCSHA